jgi:hypothetical protein
MSNEKPLSIGSGNPPALSSEMMQPARIDERYSLPEELETVAQRVRKRLKNMSADVVEIGRELHLVKQRLEHGCFLGWVEKACGLSARTAQLMMRAAEWAEGRHEIIAHLEPTAIYLLAAPSTPEAVRQQVMSRLEEGQTLAPRLVKDMIRAAKRKEPGKEDPIGHEPGPGQLDSNQSDSMITEASEEQYTGGAQALHEEDRSATDQEEADHAETPPPQEDSAPLSESWALAVSQHRSFEHSPTLTQWPTRTLLG